MFLFKPKNMNIAVCITWLAFSLKIILVTPEYIWLKRTICFLWQLLNICTYTLYVDWKRITLCKQLFFRKRARQKKKTSSFLDPLEWVVFQVVLHVFGCLFWITIYIIHEIFFLVIALFLQYRTCLSWGIMMFCNDI